MKQLTATLIALGILSLAGGALAEQKSGRTIRMNEVIIVCRAPRPLAVVDAAKVQPQLMLGDLKLELSDRIEAATGNEPF